MISDSKTHQAFEVLLKSIYSQLTRFPETNDPGLFGGQTGYVLFLMNYYRFTQNRIFYEQAFSILEMVQDQPVGGIKLVHI